MTDFATLERSARSHSPNDRVGKRCFYMKAYFSVSVLLLPFLICSLLSVGGCRTSNSQQSDLFYQIFQGDSCDFRSINLGDDVQLVRSLMDPLTPRFQDRYGLAYEYDLPDAGKLLVDYYSDNLITGLESSKVASIVAQVMLDNEVETARLYQEMREYFTRKYNLASGSYGDYVWSTATRNFGVMEVTLRLDESKRGIIINFVDTQAGTTNEPSQDLQTP